MLMIPRKTTNVDDLSKSTERCVEFRSLKIYRIAEYKKLQKVQLLDNSHRLPINPVTDVPVFYFFADRIPQSYLSIEYTIG